MCRYIFKIAQIAIYSTLLREIRRQRDRRLIDSSGRLRRAVKAIDREQVHGLFNLLSENQQQEYD